MTVIVNGETKVVTVGIQGIQGAGVTEFLTLQDTPSTFVAGKILKVNTAANALEYADNDTNLTYTASTRLLATDTGTNITLPLVTTATDGLLSASDKTKLDGIELNSKDDQTGSEIKVLYEGEADTNAFNDAFKQKLEGIEATATQDQTASEIKALYESEANTNAYTDSEKAKLLGIESAATQDQTDAEIRALVDSATDSNVLTDALKNKIDGIEQNATQDQSDAEIRAAVEAATDSNVFTDADHNKLNLIEDQATQDQTGAEIKQLYEAESNTNAYTDSEKAKLAAVEAQADVTDTSNVDAAGAVMNSDTDTTPMGFVVDEDNMASNSSTKVPTQQSVKAYVDTEVADVVNSAPSNLDTLKELSDALGADANFSTTVTNNIATKLAKAGGTMTGNIAMQGTQTVDGRDLSVDGAKLDTIESNSKDDQTDAEIKIAYENNTNTNAYTDAEKSKLNQIAAQATNVTNNNQIANGANYVTASIINSLDANNLSSGTIPDARFPSVLPAISAANLTNLPPTIGGSNGVDFNDNISVRFGTSNDLTLTHDGTNSKINSTEGTLKIEHTGNGTIEFRRQGGGGIDIDGNGWLLPSSTNSIHLGYSSYRWNKIWGNEGDFSGTLTTSAITPSATQTYNLGSSSNKWNQVHAETLFVGSTVNAVGGMFSSDIHASQGKFSAEVTCDHVLPNSDISYNLGSASDRWYKLYIRDIYLEDNIRSTNGNAGKITFMGGQNSGQIEFVSSANSTLGGLYFNVQQTFGVLKTDGTYRFKVENSGQVNVFGDMLPDSNNVSKLGLSGNKWEEVHATTYYGDGSNLTNLPAPNLTALTQHVRSNQQVGIGDANGFDVALSNTGAGGFLTCNSGSITIKSDNTNDDVKLINKDNEGVFLDGADDAFKPITNNVVDLGSTSLKYKNVHAAAYYGNGSNLTNLPTPDWTSVNNNLLPDVDSARDIGSNSKRFATGYLDYLNVLHTATVNSTFTAEATTYLKGDVNLGDSNADLILFYGSLNTDIIPLTNNTRKLGTSQYGFSHVYANSFHGDGSNLTGVVGTGTNTFTGNQTISNADPKLILNDTTSGTNYSIYSDGGQFRIMNESSGGGIRFTVTSNGSVFTANNLDVSGNISLSGTVDGVDIAAFKTSFDNLSTDLVNDSSPELGGNLYTNGNFIGLGDSSHGNDDRLKFGNHDDLQIYHDSTTSIIKDTKGDFDIIGDSIDLKDTSGNKKLETTSTSVDVHTGILGIKNSGTQSEMRLYCESNNAHYAAIKAPAHSTFSGNLTYTLPSSYGNNAQVLTSDGSGGTSWTTPSSGGASVGGANTQVQFNSSGALAGSSNLTFDGTNVTVGGTVTATSSASGNAGLRKITASTAAPSGGSDGDVWIKYS